MTQPFTSRDSGGGNRIGPICVCVGVCVCVSVSQLALSRMNELCHMTSLNDVCWAKRLKNTWRRRCVNAGAFSLWIHLANTLIDVTLVLYIMHTERDKKQVNLNRGERFPQPWLIYSQYYHFPSYVTLKVTNRAVVDTPAAVIDMLRQSWILQKPSLFSTLGPTLSLNEATGHKHKCAQKDCPLSWNLQLSRHGCRQQL